MYIEVKEMLVNLDKVSNVGFLDSKRRIVFNFSHAVEIQNNRTGEWNTIADYKYYDAVDDQSYEEKKQSVKDALSQSGFIEPQYYAHYWINPKQVSYINTDKNKNRLIFNLNTSVDVHMKQGVTLGNDFVFWTFDNEQDFIQAMLDFTRNVML